MDWEQDLKKISEAIESGNIGGAKKLVEKLVKEKLPQDTSRAGTVLTLIDQIKTYSTEQRAIREDLSRGVTASDKALGDAAKAVKDASTVLSGLMKLENTLDPAAKGRRVEAAKAVKAKRKAEKAAAAAPTAAASAPAAAPPAAAPTAAPAPAAATPPADEPPVFRSLAADPKDAEALKKLQDDQKKEADAAKALQKEAVERGAQQQENLVASLKARGIDIAPNISAMDVLRDPSKIKATETVAPPAAPTAAAPAEPAAPEFRSPFADRMTLQEQLKTASDSDPAKKKMEEKLSEVQAEIDANPELKKWDAPGASEKQKAQPTSAAPATSETKTVFEVLSDKAKHDTDGSYEDDPDADDDDDDEDDDATLEASSSVPKDPHENQEDAAAHDLDEIPPPPPLEEDAPPLEEDAPPPPPPLPEDAISAAAPEGGAPPPPPDGQEPPLPPPPENYQDPFTAAAPPAAAPPAATPASAAPPAPTPAAALSSEGNSGITLGKDGQKPQADGKPLDFFDSVCKGLKGQTDPDLRKVNRNDEGLFGKKKGEQRTATIAIKFGLLKGSGKYTISEEEDKKLTFRPQMEWKFDKSDNLSAKDTKVLDNMCKDALKHESAFTITQGPNDKHGKQAKALEESLLRAAVLAGKPVTITHKDKYGKVSEPKQYSPQQAIERLKALEDEKFIAAAKVEPTRMEKMRGSKIKINGEKFTREQVEARVERITAEAKVKPDVKPAPSKQIPVLADAITQVKAEINAKGDISDTGKPAGKPVTPEFTKELKQAVEAQKRKLEQQETAKATATKTEESKITRTPTPQPPPPK